MSSIANRLQTQEARHKTNFEAKKGEILTFSEGLTNFIKSECGSRRFKGPIKTSGSKKIKKLLTNMHILYIMIHTFIHLRN